MKRVERRGKKIIYIGPEIGERDTKSVKTDRSVRDQGTTSKRSVRDQGTTSKTEPVDWRGFAP